MSDSYTAVSALDQIAAMAGWDVERQNEVLLDFICWNGLDVAFAKHADATAKRELGDEYVHKLGAATVAALREYVALKRGLPSGPQR